MFKLITCIRKIVAMSVASIVASLTIISSVHAETLTEKYLRFITQFTFDTSQAAYYMSFDLLALLNSWILPDKTDTTSKLQLTFVNNTNAMVQNSDTQNSLQRSLMKNFLKGVTASNVDYVNDFTYQTLFGKPYIKKDPRGQKIDASLNYLKNVAGLNIFHQIPAPNGKGKGSDQDKENYRNFYTTISAIQSYDAYVLTELYLTNLGGKDSFSKKQNALMEQASNSTWFAQVASESVGVVLRQILMYNSQTFVLLTELLKTQKQMLAAQAMSNTLLVLGNQFTESQLLSRATGIIQ